jgi:hypothetical protein
MSKHDGGKGDAPRPLGVSMEQFDSNFDAIFGKKNKLADKLVKQVEDNLKQTKEKQDDGV